MILKSLKIFYSKKGVFYLIAVISFCIFANKHFYNHIYRKLFKDTTTSKKTFYHVQAERLINFQDSTKYILLWTNHKCTPFVYFEEGTKVFTKNRCKWSNCFVTGNRNYLASYTEFDVIAFNGPQIPFTHRWPTKRSISQKYVYASIESASNYPILNDDLNGVFNWTWTYKLNSDAVWGYFVVKDANNSVIGPAINVPWININQMDPIIDNHLKKTLQNKKKAAVWFASNCHTTNGREDFVSSLQDHLRNYKMEVDVYGACGPRQCPHKINDHCLRMVRNNYYFYLAFENTFSEDYVTEKVVYALKYDAVPVVYGGANYSRFLPDGTYLDARILGPMLLAKTMYEMIQNPEEYYKFFRWKKHYSFHFKNESPDTDDYCKFCALLNNETLLKEYSVSDDIRSWWMQGTEYDEQS